MARADIFFPVSTIRSTDIEKLLSDTISYPFIYGYISMTENEKITKEQENE